MIAPPRETPSITPDTHDCRDVSVKSCYVVATAQDYDGFSVLSVYKSIRCRDDQSWMRPVVEELEGRCFAWSSAEVLKDIHMIGHAAMHIEYHVFRECPGEHYVHKCAKEEHGRVSVREPVQGIPSMRVPVLPVED